MFFLDILLKRYGGNLDYLYELPYDTCISLIETAVKETNRDNVYRQYLAILPYMSEKTYKPFDKYYSGMVGKEFTFDVANNHSTKVDKKNGLDIARQILKSKSQTKIE